LGKLSKAERDRVLLASKQIEALNAQSAELEGAWRDPLSAGVAEPAGVQRQYDERLAWMRSKVENGDYVADVASDWDAALSIAADAVPVDRVHALGEETPVWCAPLDSGLYVSPRDPAFDRNRCGSAHPGEWARALREVEREGRVWTWVHLGHAVGWISGRGAHPLGPSVDLRRAREIRDGRKVWIERDGATTSGGRRPVLVSGADGFSPDTLVLESNAGLGTRPLTRRRAWTVALSELDRPYGWGGREGHRDCSRLVRDVFVPFGLQLARHSAVQAKQGTESIEVEALDEGDKRAAIRAAAKRGLVLLYMRGHIMLYLGEDVPEPASGEGTASSGARMYAVSAISEFVEPCPSGADLPDLVNRLDRVAVTTLELGRGSTRSSFIERISRLVVFGAPESGAADTAVSPDETPSDR
jgi:hypothetical protein